MVLGYELTNEVTWTETRLTLLYQISRLHLKIYFCSDVSQPIDIRQPDYLRFDIDNAVRKLRVYCDSLPANLT